MAFGAAPAAASTTFGANLNRQPYYGSSFTCGDYDQLYNFGYAPPSPNYNSCSWDFQDVSTRESVFPPAGLGVISRVRVRVGWSTGPMQIVVEEAYNVPNPSDPGHPGYSCCKAIELSQVFVPNQNAITTVPVHLTVRQGADPTTGVETDDHLALSVLARNVQIPAAQDSNAYDGIWFPAWQSAGQERLGGPYGTSGAAILFNADWDPITTGGGGGLDVGQVHSLANGTANVPVTLPGPGLLTARDAKTAGGASVSVVGQTAAKKARVKSIRKTVTRAGTVTLKIKPSKLGKRTLRHRHKLKVKLRITFTPSGSKTSITKTVTVTLKLKHH
ncbi:MAG: hypothetical protein JOZ73_10595 [Solirubrobacterales bacterium]|nr:hypothetical protein [Solirubrobacterales bacterium]